MRVVVILLVIVGLLALGAWIVSSQWLSGRALPPEATFSPAFETGTIQPNPILLTTPCDQEVRECFTSCQQLPLEEQPSACEACYTMSASCPIESPSTLPGLVLPLADDVVP